MRLSRPAFPRPEGTGFGVFCLQEAPNVWTAEDVAFMDEALRLARLGLGFTSPNPAVGAVCVRDGQIVGSGYHAKAGDPHAEVVALEEAGEAARGATLYVTLEPCSHYGRTPPCADLCIQAGLSRVVIAMIDPNPLVSGAGVERLRTAGIQVEVGLRQEEAAKLNEAFIVYMKEKRPFVHFKTAMSADGKVACRTGKSQWITSEASRREVHRLRSRHDAIMVGIGTVLADDPRLTVRLADAADVSAPDMQPTRIIVDSRAAIPLRARCLEGAGDSADVIVAVSEAAPPRKIQALRDHGVRVWVGTGPDGRVDLVRLLHDLADLQITSIFLEGGPTLAGSFFDHGLVDRVTVFMAPLVLGGAFAPSPIAGQGVDEPHLGYRLTDVSHKFFGEDFMWTGTVQRRV